MQVAELSNSAGRTNGPLFPQAARSNVAETQTPRKNKEIFFLKPKRTAVPYPPPDFKRSRPSSTARLTCTGAVPPT